MISYGPMRVPLESVRGAKPATFYCGREREPRLLDMSPGVYRPGRARGGWLVPIASSKRRAAQRTGARSNAETLRGSDSAPVLDAGVRRRRESALRKLKKNTPSSGARLGLLPRAPSRTMQARCDARTSTSSNRSQCARSTAPRADSMASARLMAVAPTTRAASLGADVAQRVV